MVVNYLQNALSRVGKGGKGERIPYGETHIDLTDAPGSLEKIIYRGKQALFVFKEGASDKEREDFLKKIELVVKDHLPPVQGYPLGHDPDTDGTDTRNYGTSKAHNNTAQKNVDVSLGLGAISFRLLIDGMAQEGMLTATNAKEVYDVTGDPGQRPR